MTAIMEWRPPATVGELAVELFLDRLARLVQLEVTDDLALSAVEQQRLRTLAVVATIEALTALGAGSGASRLLRSARQVRGPLAV